VDRRSEIDALIEQYTPLANSLAARLRGLWAHRNRDELQQIAKIALWHAIEDYDARKGVPISAWITLIVGRRLVDQIRDHGPHKRSGIARFTMASIEDYRLGRGDQRQEEMPIVDHRETPIDHVYAAETFDSLLVDVPVRYREWARMYYLDGLRLKDIGRCFGKSESLVSQVFTRHITPRLRARARQYARGGLA
jgi:RNA polymerase sigma factor (sigma-70 family)